MKLAGWQVVLLLLLASGLIGLTVYLIGLAQ
jgi:hypothetical protein